MSQLKRALLVGIDRYDNFNGLRGCVNDVNALRPLLLKNEDQSPNFACDVLISPPGPVPRANLLAGLQKLLSPGADVALFYFSGHGTLIDNDAVLTTEDGNSTDPGVSISKLMTLIQHSPVAEIIIMLDCCFSGAAAQMSQLGTSVAALRHGVSILAASRGDQVAMETGKHSRFSTYLCAALAGEAADILGNVTVAGVYAYLSASFGAWGQRPTFKANIERLHEVRVCSPAVPLSELRQLPTIFETETTELTLDPSYEPTVEPRHAENEATFAILQRCRAAHLVEPVGADHLYFAAMNKKACRCTPLGRHYWRLAKEGRL